MFFDRRHISSSSGDYLRANDDAAELVPLTRKRTIRSNELFDTDTISYWYVVGSFTAIVDSEIFAIFMYIVFAH